MKLAFVPAILFSFAAAAAPQRRSPPREAIDACHDRAAGDTCTATFKDRTISGTCRVAPDGEGPLACMPDRPPPPPEAFSACEDHAAGDACKVEHDGQTLDGTCRNGPDGKGPLACAPARPPAP